MKICLVAAEKSGDELGASLKREIEKQAGDKVTFCGIGGAAMAAEGLESPVDISVLSVLGIVEGIKAYPYVLDRVEQSKDFILAEKPDMVVLIDSWGFSIRVAKAVRKAGSNVMLVKYLAPQVWATRPGRAKVLADAVDHLLSIQTFDEPYFKAAGLPTTFVGNPMFDTDYTAGDGEQLRRDLNLRPDQTVISVMFGSRLSEIQRLATPFADTVEILRERFPDLVMVSPVADTIATDVRAAAGVDSRLQEVIFLEEDRKLDAFAASKAALSCSGTVTTQLAAAGVPSVVAYKLSGLTYFILKRLYKPNHISLVNIAAGEEVMPEFIQKDVNGPTLADAMSRFLTDEDYYQRQHAKMMDGVKIMKGKGGRAAERAASKILDLLDT